MTMTYRYFTTMMLAVLVAFVAGCGGSSGPKVYPVAGTVTLNGIPVDGATVSFNSADGNSAVARTDASGKYKLISSFGTEGTVLGTYSVTISKAGAVKTGKKVLTVDENGNNTMVDEMTRKEALPAQYASSADTPFKNVAVDAKKLNTHDFDLK